MPVPDGLDDVTAGGLGVAGLAGWMPVRERGAPRARRDGGRARRERRRGPGRRAGGAPRRAPAGWSRWPAARPGASAPSPSAPTSRSPPATACRTLCARPAATGADLVIDALWGDSAAAAIGALRRGGAAGAGGQRREPRDDDGGRPAARAAPRHARLLGARRGARPSVRRAYARARRGRRRSARWRSRSRPSRSTRPRRRGRARRRAPAAASWCCVPMSDLPRRHGRRLRLRRGPPCASGARSSIPAAPDTAVEVAIPLRFLNRHGLIAGATGTGKTRTLQLIAEQISAAGCPVFAADMKGDLAGIGAAGRRRTTGSRRAPTELADAWSPAALPGGAAVADRRRTASPIRATVTEFGPTLLSKVLELNETQESSLGLIFRFCDEKALAADRPGGPARGARLPDRPRQGRAEDPRRHLRRDRRRAAAQGLAARGRGRRRLLRRARLRGDRPAAHRARRPRASSRCSTSSTWPASRRSSRPS